MKVQQYKLVNLADQIGQLKNDKNIPIGSSYKLGKLYAELLNVCTPYIEIRARLAEEKRITDENGNITLDIAGITKELEPLAKEEVEFNQESLDIEAYEWFSIAFGTIHSFIDLFGKENFKLTILKKDWTKEELTA